MKATHHDIIKKLVLSGIFAAFTVLLTILSIPLSSGYIHLGDTAIFVGVHVIGGVWGILAGAIGSALADLILGYAMYIPATFIIKGLMALIATLLIVRMPAKQRIFAFIIACLIVPLGYFLYESVLYGVIVAAATVPYNLLQGVLSAVLGFTLTIALDKFNLPGR